MQSIKSKKYTVYLGYLAIGASLVSWGVSFPLAKYAMQYLDLYTLLFWRLAIGCVVAVPFLFLRYQAIKRAHIGTIFVWGMSLIPVCLLLQFLSLEHISASVGSLAIGLEFPFAIFWLWILYKKRPNILALWITLIGFSGLALIVGDFKWSGIIGVIFVLGGGISFALGSTLSDKVSTHYDPIFTSAIAMVLGCVFFGFLWMFWGETPTADIPLHIFGVAGFMGIVNSFITIFLWTYGVKIITVARAAQLVMIEPLVGAIVSILWLGEYWYWGTVVGGAMIIISMMMDSRKAIT